MSGMKLVGYESDVSNEGAQQLVPKDWDGIEIRLNI